MTPTRGKEHEAVVGRFVPGAEATREAVPGTGPGPAVVRAVVEHHGGALPLPSAGSTGTPGQLEAQGATDVADTSHEDLVPVGVQAPAGGRDAPGPDGRFDVHSEEQ